MSIKGCSARHASPDISPAEHKGPLMVAWCVEGRDTLIVGGGAVSARRVRALLDGGARVRVVAPLICAELRGRLAREEVRIEERKFVPEDLEGAALVMVAIDDPEASREIATLSRAMGIPVHVADVTPLCDFIFPALHREGPIQVAISTGGMGPAIAARLRDRIALALPGSLVQATRRFGALRSAIRAADPRPEASERRMDWLKQVGRDMPLPDMAALSEIDIERLVSSWERGESPQGVSMAPVRLVGAGPGDPRLLTVAAVDALAESDLVLADRLVPPAILALARGEVRVADKRPGRADSAQAELHAWMLEGVRAGRTVVRLKCGDPYVFGRGSEEVDFLGEHGIPVEVVPGISSALAGPSAAGIPVTARHFSDRLVVVTARGAGNRPVEPPPFREDQTVVFLMGIGQLERLVQEMKSLGYPSDWPAAVISNATRPGQKSVVAGLDDLAVKVREAGLRPPGVVVVGRVVECATEARSLRATA